MPAALFPLTLALGAALLLVVQPLFAKMALPLLGGTPAVWNTCLVFYQAALLAGYAYAHAASRLPPRAQIAVHALVLLAPLAFLPIALPPDAAPPATSWPVLWLAGLLLSRVGPPFFAVAATAPLLSAWFARTGRDPYPLYSASNAGSIAGLALFPLLLEPAMNSSAQSLVWTAGYVLLALAVLSCGALSLRARPAPPATPDPPSPAPPPRLATRLRWIALGAVPSSLLLGVTTHITTDVAAVPLLWTVPLALYLLTFVVAFARRPLVPHAWMLRAQPVLVLALAALAFFDIRELIALLLPLHLAAFFVCAMVCHGELAASRPPPARLTEFYLLMSAGGVLGGLFNALVAPLAFSGTPEYAIALVAACALRPWTRVSLNDFLLPAAGVALLVAFRLLARAWHWPFEALVTLVVLAAAAALFAARRPARLTLAVAGLLVAGVVSAPHDGTLLRERSFFGVYRVVLDEDTGCRVLVHGTTMHGAQSIDTGRRGEALLYFHPNTLAGALLLEYRDRENPAPIAVVGLGAGTLASYAVEGQRWDFYEIDPLVERIARDASLFTYLADASASASVRVILGDARLRLREAPDGTYGILALDAFSSDAVPVHLITREALALYLRKLAPQGVVAFHVTNRYLDMRPMLAALAADAGLAALEPDPARHLPSIDPMIHAADWVIMARRPEHFGPLLDDPRWRRVVAAPGTRVWTDAWSNVLGALKLRS